MAKNSKMQLQRLSPWWENSQLHPGSGQDLWCNTKFMREHTPRPSQRQPAAAVLKGDWCAELVHCLATAAVAHVTAVQEPPAALAAA